VKANSKRGDSPTCYLAYFVHQFASAYGWSEDQILNKPIARLYQLLRQMQMERNPRITILNSRLAKLEDEYAMKAWELEQEKEQRK